MPDVPQRKIVHTERGMALLYALVVAGLSGFSTGLSAMRAGNLGIFALSWAVAKLFARMCPIFSQHIPFVSALRILHTRT